MNPIVKVYAAPGIDSPTNDYGVFNSGAGTVPFKPTKVVPYEWNSNNPSIEPNADSNLVGNYKATAVKNANAMRIRKRGASPWGGFPPGRLTPTNLSTAGLDNPAVGKNSKSGGIVDHNAGADTHIAGGKGGASSFVRLHGRRGDAGLKLPQMPRSVVRGGMAVTPAGGSGAEGYAASPIQPKLPGFSSIFNFVRRKER